MSGSGRVWSIPAYPRDLFFGRSTSPFLDATLEINDGWLPPARWHP
jgi:hypothetical protein